MGADALADELVQIVAGRNVNGPAGRACASSAGTRSPGLTFFSSAGRTAAAWPKSWLQPEAKALLRHRVGEGLELGST